MTASISIESGADRQTRDGVPGFAAEVARTGFVVPRRAALERLMSAADLEALRGAWEDMPVDDQIAPGATYRERRYGRLRAEVSGDEVAFDVLPHTTFRQDVIPMWTGKSRRFAPIDDRVLTSAGLRALIGFDARLATALTGHRTWEIGIHLVRIVARAGAAGRPTPEGRHRDGHEFVGMHLLRRDGVTGGLSTVYSEDGGEPVRTTLLAPLDSMFVDDSRVTHEVSPTSPVGDRGVRDMLLVDVNRAPEA